MSLERFCRKPIVTADPEVPASEIARRMRDEHVGCVVVVERGKPIGIITDRDLVVRLLAEKRSPDEPVAELMTPEPVTVLRSDSLDTVVHRMREAGVRRVPIVSNAGAIVGLVSLDDVSVLLAGELSASVEAIRDDRGP